MSAFNESLSGFLVERREAALEELKSDSRYVERSDKLSDVLSRLETCLNPEAKALFEEYAETIIAIKSMEYNKTLLCGLTMQTGILTRFDVNTSECKAFMVSFL